MKVINTYVVNNENYNQKDILFECLENRWYHQKEILQNEWQTIVVEISEPEAMSLINNSL